MVAEKKPWGLDVLERENYAIHLTKLIERQFSSRRKKRKDGAICLALDGEWGAGKTFFVHEWASDLRNQQYPVIQFDAWKNDLTEDALVGFMADLSMQLKEWTQKLPKAKRVGVQKQINAFVKQAGKAVVPAAQEIAKGLFKKAVGSSIDSIVEQWESSPKESRDSGDWLEVTEGALEKFFENSLEAHTQRQGALENLRGTFALLAEHLEQYAQATLPMYVFIDELDRCRPDYAIRLLEGVKHLFDASGVCFIFSINVSQLAHSVRAVYGEGFDSRFYLKRFFTFDYSLPPPDHKAFARSIVGDSLFASEYNIYTGLPVYNRDGTEFVEVKGMNAAKSFSVVAAAFNLDLRSQIQVLRLAEAAVVQFAPGTTIHVLFLFFLVSVFHRNREVFLSLEHSGIAVDYYPRMGYSGFVIKYSEERKWGGWELRETSLNDVFHLYQKLARVSISSLINSGEDSDKPARYPETIKESILRPYYSKPLAGDERTPVADYFYLVKFAGQVISA